MMPPMLLITDVNGADYARFLIFEQEDPQGRPDPLYFGGLAHDVRPAEQVHGLYGPHMWLSLAAMLGVIGSIANMPGAGRSPMQLSAGGRPMFIQPDMNGLELAAALRCSAAQIIDHYGLTVRLIPREN